ncbi:uncharacterized protein UDID_03609 [Ustilago sp. UG-2017a]|nr:uncharacterized protein UDID_03609 [Ustilago sp. UG-2017a]
MPYQYLTFSDLYEEEVRSSAPSSPVMGATASLSPVFLLPSAHPHASSSSQTSSSSHRKLPSRTYSQRGKDVNESSLLQTSTSECDEIVSPTSSPSTHSSIQHTNLHLDFFKMFSKRRNSKKSKNSDSAFSTPASSRRSSFTSHYGFASLHPASAASSANTSPAISRQVTKMSDYDALVQRTAREEQEEEENRQRELQAYLNQAAGTGLTLRRV